MRSRALRSDCEIETDDYIITYDITDESFDHEFGVERQYGYEITSVLLYVPALDEFLDEDYIYSDTKDEARKKIKDKISAMVDKAIDDDIASYGYFEDIEVEFENE